MKTNVTLQSEDRKLFGITIRQQTKDEMLSITDLQKAYDRGKFEYGWSGQSVSQIMQNDSFVNKCHSVLYELGIIKVGISTFIEQVNNEKITNVLKSLGVYKTSGKGENKAVYANPYIWMTVALELNYKLYGKVIIWLTDSLIFDRIDAGMEYKPMNTAIKSIIETPDYSKYAVAINNKVFGFHQTGMRNIASSKELRKIADIEKFVINSIELGFIKEESGLMKAILNSR